MGDEIHGNFGVFQLESYGQATRDMKNEAFWELDKQQHLISPPLPRTTSVSVKDLLNPEAPQDQSQHPIARSHEHEREVCISSRTILPYPSGMAAPQPPDKIRRYCCIIKCLTLVIAVPTAIQLRGETISMVAVVNAAVSNVAAGDKRCVPE